jgi:hypothetical protein
VHERHGRPAGVRRDRLSRDGRRIVLLNGFFAASADSNAARNASFTVHCITSMRLLRKGCRRRIACGYEGITKDE